MNTTEGQWRWETGELVVFQKWYRFDFINMDEAYVMQLRNDDWRHDIYSTNSAPVTCEMEYGK